jgi:putative transposase
MTNPDPICFARTSCEIAPLSVLLFFRFPLLLGNVEDLLHERGIDVSYEAGRFWWDRCVRL